MKGRDIKITAKSIIHPYDSEAWKKEVIIENINEIKIGREIAKILLESMFAEWGYYQTIYYPNVELLIEYLPVKP